MAFTSTLRRGWRKILDAMSLEDEREKLLEKLREQYGAEAHNAAQFTAHARRMYYPQFCDRLLRIAAEVSWSRGKNGEGNLSTGGSSTNCPAANWCGHDGLLRRSLRNCLMLRGKCAFRDAISEND